MGEEFIFVSYSSKDRPFAMALTEELEKLGAKIWIDQLGIKLGENWDSSIESALESADTLLLIISPTSIESQNVQDEVSIAIHENKKFVPIMIKPCELPMRWKRKQYADLTANPDKAIHDILQFLGLQEKAATNLKNLLSLIDVSESPQRTTVKKSNDDSSPEKQEEINLEDLLVSNAEIDAAVDMHKRGIKKNWQLIIFVAILSLALLGVLGVLTFSKLPTQQIALIIIGCLSLNLMSVRPYGFIKKRIRNIDLIDLLKLKKERLTRVINKLTDVEIENFNDEFINYINN
jgi:hypothetical protein